MSSVVAAAVGVLTLLVGLGGLLWRVAAAVSRTETRIAELSDDVAEVSRTVRQMCIRLGWSPWETGERRHRPARKT